MAEKIIKKRRRYTDEEKAAALALTEFNSNLDYPIAVTAKALQVPDSTIDTWKKGEWVSDKAKALSGEKKQNLAELCEAYAIKSLTGLLGDGASPVTPRDFASIGIAIDKMLLLRGQPTAITESRNDAALREKALAILERLLTEYAGDRVAALAALREHAPTLSKYVN